MIINIFTGLIQPFYGVAVLAGAVLVSLFFVLSYNRGFKIFIVVIAALGISGALFLNIYYLNATENFSNYLFKFGFLQGIEFIIIFYITTIYDPMNSTHFLQRSISEMYTSFIC